MSFAFGFDGGAEPFFIPSSFALRASLLCFNISISAAIQPFCKFPLPNCFFIINYNLINSNNK